MNFTRPGTYLGICITGLLLFAFARGIAGFDGLYGQDAYEYLRYSQALRLYFTAGVSPGDYFWPVGYPFMGALLSFITPSISFSLQLISALSASLTIIYTIKTIDLIFPPQKTITLSYLFVFLGLSPFMMRLGLSIMPDMLTVALLMMAVYNVLKYIQSKKIFFLLMAAFMFSSSIMCRYGAVVIALPCIIYSCYIFFRQKKQWLLLPLLIVLSLLPMLPHYIIRANNPTAFIQHDWLINWSPFHFWQHSFTTKDGTAYYTIPNIIYSLFGLFHPRYFLAGIIFLIFGFRKFQWPIEIKLTAISLVIYLVFLAGIPFQNNRFLLVALPFIMIVLYQSAFSVTNYFGKQIATVGYGLATLVQLALVVIGFYPVWKRNSLEKEIYVQVNQMPAAGIYTMDMDISLQSRGYSKPCYNIWTTYYEKIDTNSLVLFNDQIFPKQWAGMNPMKNWEHFNQQYKLHLIKEFNGGWKLYEFN